MVIQHLDALTKEDALTNKTFEALVGATQADLLDSARESSRTRKLLQNMLQNSSSVLQVPNKMSSYCRKSEVPT